VTRWYRAYEGTVSDPKLGEAALIAGCSRSVAIAAWHAILEDAAHCQAEGAFRTTARRIAAVLGEQLAVIESLVSAFGEIGMISDGAVKAWKARQYESDNSTERSRKHREAKRNADATLHGSCGNDDATPGNADASPPEDIEQSKKDTSSLRSDGAAAPLAPKYADERHQLWAEGPLMLAAMGAKGDPKRLVGMWLRDTGDNAIAVLDAIIRARDERVIDPTAWIQQAIGPFKTTKPAKSKANERTEHNRQWDIALSDTGAARQGYDLELEPLPSGGNGRYG
jgi:hypothetical protein